MEPYGTPASIYLGVEISPSIEALNFLWDKKELINLIKLNENCIFFQLAQQANVPCSVKGFLNIQELRSRRHSIVEVKGHVVR
jgi:hypothetical protein